MSTCLRYTPTVHITDRFLQHCKKLWLAWGGQGSEHPRREDKYGDFERQIVLLGPNNSQRTAQIVCFRRASKNSPRKEPTIRLLSDGFDITVSASDFFQALCGIRDQLAAHGFFPLCYGASRNVYPSGMLRDMAEGISAYRLTIGKAVSIEDLVNIFETGPDLEVSTVAAQKAFWDAWLVSHRH